MVKYPIVLLTLLACNYAQADDASLKESAKDVGRETGEVVHKVGEAGKEVGKKVVEATREVGHAARDGAHEFHRSVTGQSKPRHHASHSSAASAAAISATVNK